MMQVWNLVSVVRNKIYGFVESLLARRSKQGTVIDLLPELARVVTPRCV